MQPELIHDVRSVAVNSPLVHNITNYVVMNWTANGLLALGASPIMAHAEEETPELVSKSQALVINIGTLDAQWIKRMEVALHAAHTYGIPTVVDPVGAGATVLRTHTVQRWLANGWISVLRGNASEIVALVEEGAATKGVDTQHASEAAVPAGRQLADPFGCVVCISGPVDWVLAPGAPAVRVHHGHPLMTRVTGMGCMATAVIGAFLAVQPNVALATVHAMTLMGMAGERAAVECAGPGTFAVSFLDELYQFSQTALTTEQGG